MEITPDKSNREIYHQEAKKGIELFEKSFKAMQKSKQDEQKEEYQKVMEECLQVMQDTAKGLMNKKLLEMKEQLAVDSQNYLNNPTDANRDKVQKDINSIKKIA